MFYLWKKLRRARAPLDGVDVVGFKRMQNGVLRGQIVRCYIANYPTQLEAQKVHPDAQGWDDGYPVTHVNHLPGPDDNVAGGNWPDDADATLPGRFYRADGQ